MFTRRSQAAGRIRVDRSIDPSIVGMGVNPTRNAPLPHCGDIAHGSRNVASGGEIQVVDKGVPRDTPLRSEHCSRYQCPELEARSSTMRSAGLSLPD